MLRINILRKHNGFLLVSSYLVILALAVLGVALFQRTIHEHKFADISKNELAARYAAERGIDYAIVELKMNKDFFTHEAVGTEPVYNLEQLSPPPTAQLANVSADSGIYTSNFLNEDAQFQVKIYSDPKIPSETVILAKGVSKGQTKLIVTKYVPSSLYRFFIFTPTSFDFGGSAYDAFDGGIHANGNIYFSAGATLTNISELSTPQFFKYLINQFVPPPPPVYATNSSGQTVINPRTGSPYTWDEVFYDQRYPYKTPTSTTREDYKYLNNYDGWNQGSTKGLLWQYPPSNGPVYLLGSTPPPGIIPEDYVILPDNPNYFGRYACNNYNPSCPNWDLISRHTSINGIKIPNYFYSADSDWRWDKYAWLQPPNYFDRFNQRWYYPSDVKDVYHFNSQYQLNDWANFLATQQPFNGGPTLEGILQDANSGGTHLEPLSIQGALYKEKAEAGGIRIKKITDTIIYVKIRNYNGNDWIYMPPTVTTIVIGEEVVFEKKSFIDQNTAERKNVIALNIGNLKKALCVAGQPCNAGLDENLIYSNHPIVLTNARDILDDGLTTVCENNIYLHGNYNDKPTESFKPSAAISARKIYTLSGTWDYPQNLQFTSNNPDYPNIYNFYCPAGNTACISGLIAGGRPADETTYPDEESSYYTTGYNWYYAHTVVTNDMTRAAPPDSDPGEPGVNPYVYDVAMVGFWGASPDVLERWLYYTNPGNYFTPPTGRTSVYREIWGGRIYLTKTDFPGTGSENPYKRRCCGTAMPNPPGGTFSPPNCADCATYPDSWPTPVSEPWGGNWNKFFYNTEFADGDVPPGDLVGYTSTVFLELEDSEINWTIHYMPISCSQCS